LERGVGQNYFIMFRIKIIGRKVIDLYNLHNTKFSVNNGKRFIYYIITKNIDNEKYSIKNISNGYTTDWYGEDILFNLGNKSWEVIDV
jgi:hypothetical protein